MMIKLNTREAGFTLIEVIISLVMTGIIASMVGTGIVTVTKGYIFAIENAHMAQKSQLAMARVSRELTELTEITAASSTAVTIESLSGIRIIGLDGTNIKIAPQGVLLTNGDILADNVNNLAITYFKGANPWVQGTDDIQLLSAIQTDMVLTRNDGAGNVTFTTTVNPRNNQNYGGLPPSIPIPPIAPSYGGSCFVATAAYGQAYHPAVLLLKEFRDKCLLTWTGGRKLIRIYDTLGPYLAKGIKDKPVPQLTARILLSPLVGLAFLMLKSPLLILLIILIAWLISGLNSRLPEFIKNQDRSPLANSKGGALITLIVTMLIFSAIGSAMLHVDSSSSFNQLAANNSKRCYYLAESGFRYASSIYLNESNGALKDGHLETLHNAGFFNLAGNNEHFDIEVYPYFFKTTADPNGTHTLQTKVPGGIPAGLNLSNGELKIGSTFYTYANAVQAGNNITFTMTSSMPAIAIGTDVQSTAISTNNVQNITQGGNLTFHPGTADGFPEKRGTFEVDGNTYSYKRLNTGSNLLEYIDTPDSLNFVPFTVDPSSRLVLEKFVKIYSTGIIGQGDMLTSCEMVYHTPIGWITSQCSWDEKIEETDSLDNLDNWFTGGSPEGQIGTHSIQDNSLYVASTGTQGSGIGTYYKSHLVFDRSEAGADLPGAWYSAGRLLSYDVQVKIKNQAKGERYMAGITFRLASDGSCYGVSFSRGGHQNGDGIPNTLVPNGDVPGIVLWKQTGDGSSLSHYEWLAYKTFPGNDGVVYREIFKDDMESGDNGWDTSNYDYNQWARVTNKFRSGSYSWTDSPSGKYHEHEDGYLISPSFDLTKVSDAYAKFWYTGEVDSGLLCDDYAKFYVLTGAWNHIFSSQFNYSSWQQEICDISSYCGNPNVCISFELDADNCVEKDGLYIDDVEIISGNNTHILDWSTLVVRVIEADTIPFINGNNRITYGDELKDSGGAFVARVVGTPILESGSWGAGNATGYVTVRDVQGATFAPGAGIYLDGTLSATTAATGERTKDNYIRVYFGDTIDHGTPGTNALDSDRSGNPRNTVNWQPDDIGDWAAVNDFFTLVAWDAVNDTAVRLSSDNTVIRDNSLTTPNTGDETSFSSPEIALHTFGESAYTARYFDDFSFQFEGGSRSGVGFVNAIQE